MKVYACIDENNVVDNVILLEDGSDWTPPENHTLVDITGLEVGIGFLYENETFTRIEDETILTDDDTILQNIIENE